MSVAPKISIITVVRNGEKHIGDTIKSVLEQTYENIEYIIVDGKSTDGTIDIIKKSGSGITRWISEPDSGIYDAMNKGVKLATGDWLLFINADDFLVSANTIALAVPHLASRQSLVVYGNVIFIYPDGKEIIHGSEWNKIEYEFRNISMRLPHQGTFHARELFAEGLFDISFNVLGDYDLLLRYLKDHDPIFIPLMIAKMRAGGISDTESKWKLLKESRKAQLKNKIYRNLPSANWILYALKLTITDFIIRSIGISGKDKLKRILGKK